MTFKEAVEDTPPPVNGAYRKGIQALENKHRRLVECTDTRQLTGSIFLDSALAQTPNHASQPRWDYGIGYKPEEKAEQVIWIEVHSATTKEVSAVLRKLNWLNDWLNSDAEKLKQMTNSTNKEYRFVWIASGTNAILKHSPQHRRLSMSEIGKVRKRLSLS